MSKWALRNLWYRQSNYFLNHNRYTASIKKLGLDTKPVPGVNWPPSILITPSGWEAHLQHNNQKIIIRKDGKVWVEKNLEIQMHNSIIENYEKVGYSIIRNVIDKKFSI